MDLTVVKVFALVEMQPEPGLGKYERRLRRPFDLEGISIRTILLFDGCDRADSRWCDRLICLVGQVTE